MKKLENKEKEEVRFDLSELHSPEEDTKFSLIRVSLKQLKSKNLDYDRISEYNFSKGTVNDWLSCRSPVPLRFVKANLQVKDVNYLCLRAGKHKIRFPKFNEDFFYLVGVILGDGCVRNSIRKKGYRSYRIVLDNEINSYSQKYLPNLINRIFGIKPIIRFMMRKNKLIRLEMCSKIITRIFTNTLNFSYGKKKDDVIDHITRLPKNLQRSFVAGLFDTDGGKSGSSYMFGNTLLKTIKFVRSFLESEGISTRTYIQKYPTSTYYHVYIPPKDKEKFLTMIPVQNMAKFG